VLATRDDSRDVRSGKQAGRGRKRASIEGRRDSGRAKRREFPGVANGDPNVGFRYEARERGEVVMTLRIAYIGDVFLTRPCVDMLRDCVPDVVVGPEWVRSLCVGRVFVPKTKSSSWSGSNSRTCAKHWGRDLVDEVRFGMKTFYVAASAARQAEAKVIALSLVNNGSQSQSGLAQCRERGVWSAGRRAGVSAPRPGGHERRNNV
jgi:hypothetical protein